MGQRIVLRKHGGPGVLKPEPFEPVPPGPGEVLVEVAYAGINFADLAQRMGLYQGAPDLPYVPGLEVSGTIAEVGAGVTGLKVGQPVAAVTRYEGYASHVTLPVQRVIPVPKGLSLEQAAAAPVNYLTAWEALHEIGRVRKGDRVLVHGGAGGVGLASITVAKHLGCEVYATCGSPEKVRFLKEEWGVDDAFDYRAAPWRPQVEAAVGKMDCVLEPHGGKNLHESLRSLRERGRVVLYGAQEATPGAHRNLIKALRTLRAMRVQVFSLMHHSTGVLAFHLGMWEDASDLRDEAELLYDLMETGKIAPPHVDTVFPFSEVAAAHQYIHDRRNIGKILLEP